MSRGPGEGTTSGPGSGSPEGTSEGGISCGAGGRDYVFGDGNTGSFGLGVGIVSSLLTEMRRDARFSGGLASTRTGQQLGKRKGPGFALGYVKFVFDISCLMFGAARWIRTRDIPHRTAYDAVRERPYRAGSGMQPNCPWTAPSESRSDRGCSDVRHRVEGFFFFFFFRSGQRWSSRCRSGQVAAIAAKSDFMLREIRSA